MSSIVRGENGGLLGKVSGVNINNAGSDNILDIPFSKYIIRRVIVTNASTSLALSLATIGIFTDSGGNGTTVVTPAILTTLSSSSKFVDMSVAVATDTLTPGQLFIRNVLAHGSPATVDVFIFGDPL